MRIVDANGKRLSGFGTKVFVDLTAGRYVTISRSALSRLLFEAADGIETVFGDEIVALDERQNQVAVRLKSGGERHFDLVVGADGLHSAVRRLAFGSQERFEKRLGYVVAAFEAERYRPREEDVYVTYSEPGRMVGRVSLRDDKTLILFVFADGAAPMHERAAQKAALHKEFGGGGWECPGILAALDKADEVYIDRVSQIRMPQWSRGRIALVGDAAYCVSLAAGQGSALAMVGAYVLAGELAKADGRYPEAFANYEAILRDFMNRKQRGAERFASAFAPKTQFGLWFRNLVIKAAAMPGIARLTFGRDIIDSLRLPNYHWPRLTPRAARFAGRRSAS
jgi:2-polyprenyl-6-methoxyphenol hydroxylase-like FAD-dependent oxidoreductase